MSTGPTVETRNKSVMALAAMFNRVQGERAQKDKLQTGETITSTNPDGMKPPPGKLNEETASPKPQQEGQLTTRNKPPKPTPPPKPNSIVLNSIDDLPQVCGRIIDLDLEFSFTPNANSLLKPAQPKPAEKKEPEYFQSVATVRRTRVVRRNRG